MFKFIHSCKGDDCFMFSKSLRVKFFFYTVVMSVSFPVLIDSNYPEHKQIVIFRFHALVIVQPKNSK